MRAQVDGVHAHARDRPRCPVDVGPGQGEHGPVVASLVVQVEQAPPGGRPQTVDDGLVPPLAHVDDAFEHRLTLAHR